MRSCEDCHLPELVLIEAPLSSYGNIADYCVRCLAKHIVAWCEPVIGFDVIDQLCELLRRAAA